MNFLVHDKRLIIFAFVIMDNHMHIVWQMQPGIKRYSVQSDFLKFTAQKIKKHMLWFNKKKLIEFKVDAEDITFQFWERNPLSVDLCSREVVIQKLAYIHQKQVRAGLCIHLKNINIHQKSFTKQGTMVFGFLTHFVD